MSSSAFRIGANPKPTPAKIFTLPSGDRPVKIAPATLALLASGAGSYSAYWWWASSRLRFENTIRGIGLLNHGEAGPADVETFLDAVARLNTRAALASVAAVALSALAALAAVWA